MQTLNEKALIERAKAAQAYPGQQILVLTNGFVYTGQVVQVDNFLVCVKARNVRRYGTDKGLGQLALHGPTSETILDDCGDIVAPMLAVVHCMGCASTGW